MEIYHAEFLLFLGICLLNIYVVLVYWKWSLGLILLYMSYRLTKVKRRLAVDKKGVLVTGCDSGFGHHIAKRLDDRGYTVYAGVLKEDSDGAVTLRTRNSSTLHVIKLDVTQEDDVNKALDFVANNSRGDLWAVVNNAGINLPGDVELATVEQYRKCADVNLYGPIRVIRAFLPLIRASRGRVVNISSVRGRFSWPGDSLYHVTKHGLETMSDSLRMEMKRFDVKVIIVEPGDFVDATSIWSPEMIQRIRSETDCMWDHASERVKQTYGRNYFYRNLKQTFEKRGTLSMDPLAEAIEDAIINQTPNIRYLVPGYRFDKYAIFIATIHFREGHMRDTRKTKHDPVKQNILARVYGYLPGWLGDIVVDKITGYSSFPEEH